MPDFTQVNPEDRGTLPARDRRQAMDWCLVLLSQGIESTAVPDPDSGQWQLRVSLGQAEEAASALQLYEQENRNWPLRQRLPWPGFAFDWTVLAWVGLMITLFALQSRPGSPVEADGICNAGLMRTGEWWRTVTATTLHADLGHLSMNLVFGVFLLGIAMGRFGSGLTLVTTTVCGALANLLPALWRPDQASGLGASGVVMAALGMLAADTAVQYWRHKQPPRLILEGLIGGLLLFVLLGMSPTSDVPAHAGGFLAGLSFGAVLARLPQTAIRRARWNVLSGFAYCAILTLAWLWALSR